MQNPSIIYTNGNNNNSNAHNQNNGQETTSNLKILIDNKNIFKSIKNNLTHRDLDESKKYKTEINNFDNRFYYHDFNLFYLSRHPDEGQINKYKGTKDEKCISEQWKNANMQSNQNDDVINNGERNDKTQNKTFNSEVI